MGLSYFNGAKVEQAKAVHLDHERDETILTQTEGKKKKKEKRLIRTFEDARFGLVGSSSLGTRAPSSPESSSSTNRTCDLRLSEVDVAEVGVEDDGCVCCDAPASSLSVSFFSVFFLPITHKPTIPEKKKVVQHKLVLKRIQNRALNNFFRVYRIF
jgi:hypothetical protein